MEKGDPGDWKKNEKESNEAKEAQGKRKGIVREARRATCFLVQGHIVHRVHDDTLATSRAQHFFGCIFVTRKKKKKKGDLCCCQCNLCVSRFDLSLPCLSFCKPKIQKKLTMLIAWMNRGRF